MKDRKQEVRGERKYRIRLRAYISVVSILTLCFACLFSCGVVVLAVVFLYHGSLTLPVVTAFCFLACALTMLLGGIMLYFGTVYFLKPIEKVNEAVNKIAKGNFEVRIERSEWGKGKAEYAHELDELEANVNHMASELAGMDHMRRDFVSNVSHEIKTPIAAIMGFTEIMLDGGISRETQKEYMMLVYDEAGRISRLCENMLHISRLEHQEIVMRHEPVKVDEQIRKCVILLSEKWEQKQQKFDLELEAITMESDSDLLQHIWINLIDNAMKYSDAGTAIHISCHTDGDKMFVSVRDEGIGIPKEKQEHIFEPFYQCEESHKKQGNGLGLSIVKRVVELLNGELKCTSREEAGTEMLVMLKI